MTALICAPAGTAPSSRLAWLTSASWPALRWTLTGSISPLTAAWILVPQPPRLLPRACSACPPVPSAFFGAGGVGVGADDGGVEDEPLQILVLEGAEELAPDALARPAAEAPEDGVPVAEALWQVAPGGAGLGDPQDGVDEQAVVLGGDTRLSCPSGQQVFDALPVLVSYRVPVRHGSPVLTTTVHAYIIRPPFTNCPHPLAAPTFFSSPRLLTIPFFFQSFSSSRPVRSYS